MKTRVLVVDDSPFIRRILSDWITSEPDMEVIGAATNGKEAVEMAAKLQPDVITLDVEMPVMNGIAALEQIMASRPLPVLMVSSVTTQGAEETMRALDLGAYDFVTKPQGSSSLKIVEAKDELLKKLRAANSVRFRKGAPLPKPAASAPKPTLTTPRSFAPTPKMTDRLVLIASSTGGPKALAHLWHMLPKGFPAPILIVQHMPAGFTESFARRLDSIGTVPCKEAQEGDRIVPGMALIAPGGKHMVIGSDGLIHLNNDGLIHGTRPAADPLFFSAVQRYGNKIVAAILTGMGRDGAEGALAVRRSGGTVYGESEETCTIYGMPKAALAAGGIDAEYGIGEIAPAIVQALEGRLQRAS